MTDEAIPTKRCAKCGEWKTVDLFSKNKQHPDGFQTRCKACVKLENQGYRQKNGDVWRERQRARYRDNVEAELERFRAYRTANADIIRERKRRYREKHKEAIRKYLKGYYKANAEAFREYKRNYRKQHPEIHRAQYKLRRARIKSNGGQFTRQELRDMRVTQNGICFYCQRQHEPNALHVDHVIPIRQGGRHEVANIVLACWICNLEKGGRRPEQWHDRWYWLERLENEFMNKLMNIYKPFHEQP